MDEKKTTFEDKVVGFMGNHPNITMGAITVGSIAFGIVCWRIQSRSIARNVVKELGKKKGN